LPPDWLAEYEHERAEAFRRGLEPVVGAAEAVRRVKTAGLKVCVASQGALEKTRMTLGLTGLRDLFPPHALFSAYDVPRPKPDPALFLHAAATMNAKPPACVVIEDTPSGVTAAVAAGMRAVGYAADSDERAAAEGKEIKIEQEERGEFQPEITVNVSMRTDVWRREAAKIALAVGSLVYPPAWRLSADAHRLREWMNNRDSSTEDGQAPPLVPSYIPPGTLFAENDEHLLYFMRQGDDNTYVNVFLFGCSYFAVPVDMTGMPVPQQAWRLDWHKPSKDGSTTWNDLLNDAVRRRIHKQAA
jgi:HAD superfamily hydrolase (TIGR01509 family)